MPVKLHGQGGDSGGGGTLYSLERELKKIDVTADPYLVGSCTLHDLQTGFRTGTEKVLGVGGKDPNGEFSKTAMHMLHGCYNV